MDKTTNEQEKIFEKYSKANRDTHNKIVNSRTSRTSSESVRLDPSIKRALDVNYYNNIMEDFESTESKKPTIRAPKVGKKHSVYKAVAILGAAALLSGYAVHEFSPEKTTVITPESYLSFCENSNEYNAGIERAEKFQEFENAINTYKKLSQNSAGLTYVQKQELEDVKEVIKGNYKEFESIYLYQVKSKVAMAYGLPQEKISSIKTSDNYAFSTISSSDNEIPDISTDLSGKLSKIIKITSTVNMPKELENSIKDIVDLQLIAANGANFPYQEITEKYDNFLKFLALEFEADEKGNISLSDKTYSYSDEDLVNYYSSSYEYLANKKVENGGKLKSSQEKRLNHVMQEMYSSLLNTISDKIINMPDSDPKKNEYKSQLVDILDRIKDSKTPVNDAFPDLYAINNELNDYDIEMNQNGNSLNNTKTTDDYER